jgi:putative membrane protein
MFKIFSIALPIAVLLVGCGAPISDDFVAKAEEAGEFEIGSSRLAQNKSQSAAVKQFAGQMISDHTAAGEKLRAAAKLQGIEGDKANAVSPAHQADMDRLEKATVAEFDPLYIDIQTKAHEEAVSLFKSYADEGKDEPLKKFAAETLPTLEQPLAHVRNLKP